MLQLVCDMSWGGVLQDLLGSMRDALGLSEDELHLAREDRALCHTGDKVDQIADTGLQKQRATRPTLAHTVWQLYPKQGTRALA